jgi:hypothetical protein
MNLPAPKGWTVYGGADGFDVIPDAAGYLWWGDDMWLTGKDRNETWQFVLCRYKNGVSERMPLPEYLNGAGRLHWTPVGLQVSVSHNEPNGTVTSKTFTVPQFAQFTAGVPVIVNVANGAVTAVDTQARLVASQALQEARTGTEIAKAALSMAQGADGRTALLINARLKSLITAIANNDRSNALDALWMDVLFQKVNDWIYGWMKVHGFIK